MAGQEHQLFQSIRSSCCDETLQRLPRSAPAIPGVTGVLENVDAVLKAFKFVQDIGVSMFGARLDQLASSPEGKAWVHKFMTDNMLLCLSGIFEHAASTPPPLPA
jgi:hypothetical protein